MGETWLITGAGRGIGLGLAGAHLARGGRVLASCRGAPSSELAELKSNYPDRLAVLDFDVRDTDAIERAAGAIAEPIDVIINNAGVYGPREPSFRELDTAGALEAFDINALGPMRVTAAFLPHLKQESRPRVVAISSLMGSMTKPGAGSLAYRLSKAALNRAMLAIGEELAPDGIAVACLRPGHVRTAMTTPSAPMTPDESAAGLLAVIDGLDAVGHTSFIDVTGALLSW
jgi:NAD(P)-dependent dehydrogenase (short-subunit alcohol dehydrogenase family)